MPYLLVLKSVALEKVLAKFNIGYIKAIKLQWSL